MFVDQEKCKGCGACVEVCPVGAAYLVAGKAVIDPEICDQCEVCIGACPVSAISVGTPAFELVRVPVRVASEPVVLSAATVLARPSLAQRLVPWAGLALTVVGREVVPRLADVLVAAVERRLERSAASPSQLRPGTPADDQVDQYVSVAMYRSVSVRRYGEGGGGQRRRHRRRG